MDYLAYAARLKRINRAHEQEGGDYLEAVVERKHDGDLMSRNIRTMGTRLEPE